MSGYFSNLDLDLLGTPIVSEIKSLLDSTYVEDSDYSFEELRRYGLYEELDSELKLFMEKLKDDQTFKARIANRVVKRLKARHKEAKLEEQRLVMLNRRLFLACKGNLPCINQCGYTRPVTLDEILYASNNFVCRDCVNKIEAEGGSAHKLFDVTNVYKIFGLE